MARFFHFFNLLGPGRLFACLLVPSIELLSHAVLAAVDADLGDSHSWRRPVSLRPAFLPGLLFRGKLCEEGIDVIRFENVHKRYGPVHAVRGLDMTVRRGEFVILIGPSGCGKTTALKMVNRLIAPTSGRVLIDGTDVARMRLVSLRRNIGYVIQETGLFPNMTIAQNVALVPRLKRWSKAKRNARVDELLHLVGLDPAVYRDRYPRHLSGGQRQRVGVARALAADPPIILMDEPFGATDPITRKQLQRELAQIKRKVQKTILFVTHDISEAFLLGDSICLLNEGEVVQHATPEELLRNPASDFVHEFIGDEAVNRQFDYLQMGEICGTPLPAFPDGMPEWEIAAAMKRKGAVAGATVDRQGRLVDVVRLDSDTAGTHGSLQRLRREQLRLARDDELVREFFPRLYTANGAGQPAANGVADPGLVVVDGQGRPQGLVSYGDVVRLIAGLVTGSAVASMESSQNTERSAPDGHVPGLVKGVIAR